MALSNVAALGFWRRAPCSWSSWALLLCAVANQDIEVFLSAVSSYSQLPHCAERPAQLPFPTPMNGRMALGRRTGRVTPVGEDCFFVFAGDSKFEGNLAGVFPLCYGTFAS